MRSHYAVIQFAPFCARVTEKGKQTSRLKIDENKSILYLPFCLCACTCPLLFQMPLHIWHTDGYCELALPLSQRLHDAEDLGTFTFDFSSSLNPPSIPCGHILYIKLTLNVIRLTIKAPISFYYLNVVVRTRLCFASPLIRSINHTQILQMRIYLAKRTRWGRMKKAGIPSRSVNKKKTITSSLSQHKK